LFLHTCSECCLLTLSLHTYDRNPFVEEEFEVESEREKEKVEVVN
jgi:hypothetical protein